MTDKCDDCRSDRALFVLLLALVIALELSCARALTQWRPMPTRSSTQGRNCRTQISGRPRRSRTTWSCRSLQSRWLETPTASMRCRWSGS